MKQPKFAVGEEVILQSKDRPDLNGEDVVIEILYHGDWHHCRVGNRDISVNTGDDGVYYKLMNKYVIGTNGNENVWCESALRKKHKPSDMSFKDLMQSINVKTSVKA